MNIVERWRRAAAFDWLWALLLSWLIPLGLIWEWNVDYKLSLVLWIIPIALLLPRFLSLTHRGSRRRRAVWYTALYVLLIGAVLDLCFGKWVLLFDPNGKYLPPIGGIPIEEFIFYVTGGLAIVLVYFWADEYWLAAYNVRQRHPVLPRPGSIVFLSPQTIALALVLVTAGVILKRLLKASGFPLPIYYTFLVLVAFVPAVVLYRTVKDLVNWRAFSFTALYVLLTSLLWETTLAIPQFWWRYNEHGMLGKYITAWNHRDVARNVDARFPIEALFVWIAVTFSVVFFYEAAKAFSYDDRPMRKRLFGPAPWEETEWGVPP
jgi:hypothetical protein